MSFSPPMTQEQIKNTIAELRKWVEDCGEETHLNTMIPKMEEMSEKNDYVTREKLMRWIGFMQGVLWAQGAFTIDELREMNTREL